MEIWLRTGAMYRTVAPPAMEIQGFFAGSEAANFVPEFATRVQRGQSQCAEGRGSEEPDRKLMKSGEPNTRSCRESRVCEVDRGDCRRYSEVVDRAEGAEQQRNDDGGATAPQ